MYKTRISKWGLRKNFTLVELEAFASTVSHFVEAGQDVPTALVDNREVPIERIKRHFSGFLQCGNKRHSDVELGLHKDLTRGMAILFAQG